MKFKRLFISFLLLFGTSLGLTSSVFADGTNQSATSNFKSMGSNNVTITPNSSIDYTFQYDFSHQLVSNQFTAHPYNGHLTIKCYSSSLSSGTFTITLYKIVGFTKEKLGTQYYSYDSTTSQSFSTAYVSTGTYQFVMNKPQDGYYVSGHGIVEH